MSEIVVRTYSFPLNPTDGQAETMNRWFDGCRWLWNQAVAHDTNRWRAGHKRESSAAMMSAIPAAREIPGSPLDGVPGTWAQGTLRQLEDGWQLHWSKVKAGKPSHPPSFRSFAHAQSVRFAVQNASKPATPDFLVRETGSARFSEVRIVKLGWVRARIDRPLPDGATCSSMVVRRDELGRWWVSFQCRVPAAERVVTGQVAGVNRGVANSLVTDSGQVFQAPGMTPGEARRRLKLEQSLARSRRINPCPADRWVGKKIVRGVCECAPGGCWKQSARYKATKLALGKVREREAARRRDATHKASAVLAGEYDVVVFEDMDVQRMTAAPKNSTEPMPAEIKSDINRGILAQSWGDLKAKTAYKTEVVSADPAFISVTCPECGHVDPKSLVTFDLFVCSACGHSDHSDRNAARNLRGRGLDALTGGDKSGPAATRAVAGRGGERIERPGEPSTFTTRPSGDSGAGHLVSLVPESWGVNSHRVEVHRPRRKRSRNAVAAVKRGTE